jgi:hypothetical protein
VPPQKGDINLSVDSTYHRWDYESYYLPGGFNIWWKRLVIYIAHGTDWYRGGGNIKDYYLDTIGFLSTLIGSNYHYFMMLLAVVFSFIYLKCLKYIVQDEDYENGFLGWCLILLFSYNQIINVHWARFPTTSWIAVLCVFNIFLKGNKRYWLLAFATLFFHGSFYVFIFILFVASITRKYEKFWIILFYISIFVSSVPQDLVESLHSVLPPRFAAYVGYATEDGLREREAAIASRKSAMFLELFPLLQRMYMNILMIIMIRTMRKIRECGVELSERFLIMYSVVFTFFTIVNFTSAFKELFERYQLITYPLVAYLAFKLYKYNLALRKAIYFAPLVLSFQMAIYLMQYYYTSGFTMCINPILTLFNYATTGEALGLFYSD